MKEDRIHVCGVVLVITLMSILFLMSGSAFGQGESGERIVEVIGSSQIKGENVAGGRDQAVANSLVAAVSRVVEELLPGETIVNNFQLLNENLYAKLDTYVRDYKVLTESVAGSHYRVMVRATVSSNRISEALTRFGIIQTVKSYPKILFLLSEYNFYDPEPRFWWGDDPFYTQTTVESVMIDILTAKGFTILDPGRLTLPLGLSLDIGDKDAVALGKKLGADVIIIGSADTAIAPNTMGSDIRSYNATLNLRGIAVGSAQRFTEIRRVTAASGADELNGTREALTEAGTLAAEELAGKVLQAWTTESTRPKYVEVTVEGTGGNIADFVRFRGALSEISGVNSIQLSEMMPDAGIIQVDYQGTAEALAQTLMKQNFVTFGINIYEINPNSLRIKLTKN